MSTIANERGAVQSLFIRYAVQAGWTCISPHDALATGPTRPVLFPVQVQEGIRKALQVIHESCRG